MEKLQGIEEYKALLKEVKKEHKSTFSNLYFMPKDIERDISLGRAEYEKNEAGVFFYFDEENYYRVCMCVGAGSTFSIPKRDKKLLVRNIYRKTDKDEKNEKMIQFEKELQKNGFDLVGTSFQVSGTMTGVAEKCLSLEKYYYSMERKGFRCIEAEYPLYKEIEDLILSSDVIKDYQMHYLTEEEKQMMPPGSYICVLDREDQICAAAIAYVHDGISRDGVFAVKEEYKMRGIAPLLTYKRYNWSRKNKVVLGQGWILIDNDASIKYHKNLGYESTGKYANDWLL